MSYITVTKLPVSCGAAQPHAACNTLAGAGAGARHTHGWQGSCLLARLSAVCRRPAQRHPWEPPAVTRKAQRSLRGSPRGTPSQLLSLQRHWSRRHTRQHGTTTPPTHPGTAGAGQGGRGTTVLHVYILPAQKSPSHETPARGGVICRHTSSTPQPPCARAPKECF